MTQQDFARLQETQMEIMDVIHSVCINNGVKYYIIGGTLLGAIRHGGFIPWDFDIDIAMERGEYEKFKRVCDYALPEEYSYRDYTNTDGFLHPHALVCKNGTELLTKYDKINGITDSLGIYVDIFPLDHAPDSKRLQERQANRLKFIKKFKSYRAPLSFSNSSIKRIARKIFRMLFFFVSINQINHIQQKEMMRYSSTASQNWCSMSSHYSYQKQCMPKEIYGEPILLDFAGRKYYAPDRYIDYLQRIFGDYMKLPPEEKRKANLDVFYSVKF